MKSTNYWDWRNNLGDSFGETGGEIEYYTILNDFYTNNIYKWEDVEFHSVMAAF